MTKDHRFTYKLSISDYDIRQSWQRMLDEYLAWAYAYHTSSDEVDIDEIVKYYNTEIVLPFGFYVDGKLAGFSEVLPYNIQSRAIEVNPCLWREYFRYGKDLFIGGSLFVLEQLNGSCCVGKTPVVNRHMINLLDSIGYQRIGCIPEACWYNRRNKFVNCVISVATRQSLLKAQNKLKGGS